MTNYLTALDIRKEFIESYDRYVSIGLDKASDTNILYIGLVRNLEKVLEKNIQYIYQHKKIFQNLDLFIYENDSTDNTKSILESAKKQYNISYITEDLQTQQYGSVKNKERIRLLSEYRNKTIQYVNTLINNNTIINPDYIVVIDLDFKQFYNEGILHSLGWMTENTNIKACAGNSFQFKKFNNYPITWNYDSWAFRLNWWEDLQRHNTTSHQDLMYWFGLWTPPVGSEPIRVNSAFGGSCIYDSKYYLQGKYDYYDCEHVCFHKYLYSNFEDFEMRLNPAQIMIFD
jgi:hypothetical protein